MTVRLFELVLFEGLGDASLVRLIVYMLMIMEDEILKMGPGDRFRYVGHGKFIVDCVQNKEYWNFLVKEYLEHDLN